MRQNDLPITFSFGVVTYLTPPPTLDDILRRVDSSMYDVKKMGKNSIKYETYGG
jgi:GGDEF domain-containing protein